MSFMTLKNKDGSALVIHSSQLPSESPVRSSELVRAHRGTRCGYCYWALYDGEWCQNKACEWSGKEPPEKVKLSNAEAATLIEAMRPNDRTKPHGKSP